MKICVFSEDDKELWNSLCKESEHCTFFHTWNWLKLLEKNSTYKLLGYSVKGKLYPTIMYDGNEPIGVFPFFYFKHPLLKIVLSPPLKPIDTLYLGPVFMDNKYHKSQTRQVKNQEYIKTLHQYLEETLKPHIILLKTSVGYSDFRPFRWLGYSISPHFTQSLKLDKGEEVIWDGYSKVIRSNIKRGEEIGIKVREGGKKDYNWLISKMESRNRLNMSHEFAYSVYDNFFPENLRVFVAEKEGVNLSGIILLLWNQRLVGWVGTPRVDFEGVTPNALIFWETMKWGIRNGYNEFEILGAEEPALFPWKRKFGTKPDEFYLVKWNSKGIDALLKLVDTLKALKNVL